MGERRALVIGSQCDGLPNLPLPFLPELATALFEVLTDQERGGCIRARSRLVVDPDLDQLVTAVNAAVVAADEDEATLVVAFVGHAEAVQDRLYLLPRNGTSPPTMDSGFLLGPRLAELIGGHANIDGLVLLVDACQSGVGVADLAVHAGMEIAETGARVQLLTATFDQAARNGCFTRTLHELLRDGLADLSSDYLLADAVAARIADACRQQEQPRLAAFQGRWQINDPGLWLARNVRAPGRWVLADTDAGAQAVDLTEHFAVTDSVERLLAAWHSARLVTLVGGAGAGKSALAAALTRPELAPGIVFPGLVDALAFASVSPTAAEIAAALAAQLGRVAGFAAAAERYQARADPEDLERQDALTRLVVGPLRELQVTGARRLRLIVDGLDQLDGAARDGVLAAARVLASEPLLSGVRMLLTGRSEVLDGQVLPAAVVRLGAPPAEELHGYLRQRGVPATLAEVIEANVRSWLDARLFADLVGGGGTAEQTAGPGTLTELYGRAVAAAVGRLGAGPAAAALAVLTAAGAGPVLPVQLLADALGRLTATPISTKQARDLLVALGGLVIRARAGTAGEHVGLFHETLVGHLGTSPAADVDVPGGHQALVGAVEADAAAPHPVYRGYAAARLPDHLWATGRYTDALSAVYTTLGHRAADNAQVLFQWVERATAMLGPDHPQTLTAANNLAYAYQAAGDLGRALPLYEQTLTDTRRVLGPDHPDTLAAANNLASAYESAGDLGRAVPLYEQTLTDTRRVLGPNHPQTLTAANNLAGAYQAAGDLGRALPLYEQTLTEREQALGPDHPTVAVVLYRLAGVQLALGDAAAAVRGLHRAVRVDQDAYGYDHPEVAIGLEALAVAEEVANDNTAALTSLRKALEIRLTADGPDAPSVAKLRERIGALQAE